MNSPSQDLNESELIALAKQAGFHTHMGAGQIHAEAGNDWVIVTKELAKFAQLLLQREGEALEVSCPHCDGSGSVEIYESVDPATRSTTVDCKSCKGNGYTIEPKAQQPTAPGGEDLEAALCFVYGMLWHVNSGVHAPAELGVTSISPELAARETRKYLLQTFPDKIKRGVGINKAREFIASLAKKEPQ